MRLYPVPRENQSGLIAASESQMHRDIGVIRACVIGLIAILAVVICTAAADLLAPTAIAIVLALVLAPVALGLEQFRIPAGLAAAMTVVVTLVGITFVTATFAPAMTEWVSRAPEIVRSVEQKLRPIKKQLQAVETASQQITRGSPPQAAASQAQAPTQSMTERMLDGVLSIAPPLLAKTVYVTILTMFLLACRRRYTDQLILMPRSFLNRVRMARICRDVRSRVSGYLFTLTMINAGLAVVTALAFWLAGIPDAVLWGLAFGILNFVPIVGPTAVILTAAVVGFATSDTTVGALLPPAILLAINTVEANVVQPWLLSRRIVISPVAIFFMVAMLVWMWGVAAAITAVPMLILFHTIAQHVPPLRPLARLLATEDRTNGNNGHEAEPFTQFARISVKRRVRDFGYPGEK